jgi:GTP-binding protein
MAEVAVAGRSNSGKSSIINSWAQTKIAKVSSSPGKTRLLNFFLVEKKFRLVDTPGYGFAARTKNERKSWQEMIETYLSTRTQLRGLILIMDIRRGWEEEEQMLTDWCNAHGIQVFVVLNKADKVNQKEKYASVKHIESEGFRPFVTSAKSKKGVEALIQAVWTEWVLKKDPNGDLLDEDDDDTSGDLNEGLVEDLSDDYVDEDLATDFDEDSDDQDL